MEDSSTTDKEEKEQTTRGPALATGKPPPFPSI